jgi:hypothetical protein
VTSPLAVPGELFPALAGDEGRTGTAPWGSAWVSAGPVGAGLATGSSREGSPVWALARTTGTVREAFASGAGGAACGGSGLGLTSSTGMTALTHVRSVETKLRPSHTTAP